MSGPSDIAEIVRTRLAAGGEVSKAEVVALLAEVDRLRAEARPFGASPECPTLGDGALALLQRAVVYRGWYVTDHSFLDAADLLRAGLVVVEDDQERMDCIAREAGVAFALSRGLVRRDPEGGGFVHGPWKAPEP